MNPLLLKAKFKSLVQACGDRETPGLDAAVEACRAAAEAGTGRRYSRAQLERCCNPRAPDYAPIDVVSVLEAFCGDPIVSRALVEARPSAVTAGDLRDETSDVTERAAVLQRHAREAMADGEVTPREAAELSVLLEAVAEELRQAAAALAANAGSGGGRT